MSATPCSAPASPQVPRWPALELIHAPLHPTARTHALWVSPPEHPLPAAIGCDLVALLQQESYHPATPHLPLLALRLLPDAAVSLWCYLPLPGDAAPDPRTLTPEHTTSLVVEAVSSGWALTALAAPRPGISHPAPPADELLRVWAGLRLSDSSRAGLAALTSPARVAPVLSQIASEALRGPLAAAAGGHHAWY